MIDENMIHYNWKLNIWKY